MSLGLRCTKLFGPIAPEIGWVPPLRYLLRRQRVLRLLLQNPLGTLLEVGCGSGALLHEFSQAGYEATGLETSKHALAMARAIGESGHGRQELRVVPSPDWREHFGVVCAFDVLEHIDEDVHALEEWLSWMRPDGRLCVTVPAHARRWGAGDEWAGHYRRYDREDLLALLRARGLVVEHFECYGFPLANLTEALGNRFYKRLLAKRDRRYDNEEASSYSGVERTEYLKHFRKLDTVLGRTALRTAMAAQALTSRTDLGSGYLVLARRG